MTARSLGEVAPAGGDTTTAANMRRLTDAYVALREAARAHLAWPSEQSAFGLCDALERVDAVRAAVLAPPIRLPAVPFPARSKALGRTCCAGFHFHTDDCEVSR
jgi:hypothetical protein